MNILFLTDNFPPEVNAPASRTFEHCREWVRAGHEVTVVTCAPNFPQGRVYAGYRNRLRHSEWMAGIRVVRVWTYIAANKGFLKRILDYASFAATGFLAGLLKQPDVVVTTSPQFFTNFAGYGLSRVKRKPWTFELRDLWPDSIRTVGAMENDRILSVLQRAEIFFYRKADRIVALTPAFKENLVGRGIEAGKIAVVPNGVDRGLFHPRPRQGAVREGLGLPEKFVIGYIGTHGMAHSLDFVVSAIACLEDPDIHFLFIGDGAEKERVVRLARSKGVRQATFLDPVPKQKVPDYLSACDAALVPLKKSETFKTVLPSKIFEAAALERPILLGVEGQAKTLVEQYGAGVCFEPENKKDFLNKVAELKENSALYQQLQVGCRNLARDFERKALAMKMLKVIREVVLPISAQSRFG